tara:strand:- start:2083 stop:2766 length:684 start_codon:yes stop_codon:yes gene_type:complete
MKKFPYQIKIDENNNNSEYISIDYSYQDYKIEIRIFDGYIKAIGIDEQKIFNFLKRLNFNDFEIFKNKNNINLYFKCNKFNNYHLILKQINNKIFFKLYKNNNLFKKAFCYINKENKQIYQNSAHIIIKHLLKHKDSTFDFKKVSNKKIHVIDKSNNNYFFFSIFDKDIIKIEYHLEEDEQEDRYLYTNKSLYNINYIDPANFLLGTIDVPNEEINKIKLERKMNEF